MTFKRIWDSSCPRIYDSWESSGKQWLIQDLAPEDDAAAIEILKDHLIPDETFCALSRLSEDSESMVGIVKVWLTCLAQRMSLGCYEVVDGKKTLVAMNVCTVDTIEERVPNVEFLTQIEGFAFKQVLGAQNYIEEKCDPFKYLELNEVLHALGLVVKRQYRGRKLASRILAAREPLCRSQGIKATATVFTGSASQISAERAGFKTICVASLKELADSGLKFPADETRVIKLMVKKFE